MRSMLYVIVVWSKAFCTVQCNSYSTWCFRFKLSFCDFKEFKEKENKKKCLWETLLCGNSQYAYLKLLKQEVIIYFGIKDMFASKALKIIAYTWTFNTRVLNILESLYFYSTSQNYKPIKMQKFINFIQQ